MAKNPLWCKPLKAWKQIFWDWIRSAEAEDLLHASIFFDFRAVEDEAGLVHALRVFLNDTLQGWSGFFRHLTENALSFKPPLGFFRNFVVESRGEHRNAFDIKSAMLPIVDFARIYALREGIAETNTLERIKQLHLKKILTWEEYNELEKAYSFMMQLRFMRQVTVLLEDNAQPDNYITPQRLSKIEQTMLKEIFRRIEKFQLKLSFAFTGSA